MLYFYKVKNCTLVYVYPCMTSHKIYAAWLITQVVYCTTRSPTRAKWGNQKKTEFQSYWYSCPVWMEHYSNFVQFDFLELGRFAWSPSAESEGKYEITHWGKAKKNWHFIWIGSICLVSFGSILGKIEPEENDNRMVSRLTFVCNQMFFSFMKHNWKKSVKYSLLVSFYK